MFLLIFDALLDFKKQIYFIILPINHMGYVVISSLRSDILSAISDTSSAESVKSAITGSGPASFNLATK